MTLGVTDGRADAERQWIRKHPEQKPWQAGRCLTGKKLPMEMAKKTTKEERKIGHKTPTSKAAPMPIFRWKLQRLMRRGRIRSAAATTTTKATTTTRKVENSGSRTCESKTERQRPGGMEAKHET